MKLSSAAVASAILSFVSAAPAPAPAPEYNHTLEARGDAPFGIKKGIAYERGRPDITNSFSRDGSATWSYNWGAQPNAPRFQQIPMYWGNNGRGDAGGVHRMIDQGARWVMGYNEPDMLTDHGGSFSSPDDARRTWGNEMFQFSDRGARLICPGISSHNTDHSVHHGGPSGLVWLRRFINGNPGAFRCDAQALHWYGNERESTRDQANAFMQYVRDAHNEVNNIFGRDMELWITEFSSEPKSDVNRFAEFLDIVMPFLDREGYVGRYAPFWAETMAETQAPYRLNRAGEVFVNKRS